MEMGAEWGSGSGRLSMCFQLSNKSSFGSIGRISISWASSASLNVNADTLSKMNITGLALNSNTPSKLPWILATLHYHNNGESGSGMGLLITHTLIASEKKQIIYRYWQDLV